ncbi:hypothetical protein EDD85DRAFT_1023634 [Armillaria nabsnona]|nr:hypothetical protein EDD85DRAFT_1023634 [Armillaria nabsnona]
MAKLVTGDEFTKGVKKHNKEVERQEDAKTAREEEKQHLERNKKRRAKYKKQVAAWEKERDVTKAEKRRPGWTKPKLAEFGLESTADKPKKKDFELDEQGGDGESTDSGSDDNKMEVGSEQESDQEADSDS